MRWVVAILLVGHGLIHLMGAVKAFGVAELPQLTQPISPLMGVAWLAAALLVIASAVLTIAYPRGVWIVGAVALVVSQAVIVSSWTDARAGTVANVVLLIVVAHSWFNHGPRSFRAQFERDKAVGLARSIDTATVTEADLAHLPGPVQRYLRVTGVMGRPRVQNYRLRFQGRIRSGPDAAWMPFDAEQLSFADQPTRLFFMHARMFMVPVEVFHRRIGGHATMQVKIVGAIPMVDARGDDMDRAEAVTLFNDMCLLAPGTLVDPAIAWEPVDAHTARARFTDGSTTIAATLQFNDEGLLTNFISDDRSRSSPDGKSFTRLRFSTPVRDYRDFGGMYLAAHGDARWRLPEGEFTYGEFNLQQIEYNVRH